ncbi:hypothetical protein [Pseudonocardia sp. WMMC193]|uniref:hypothetical protein n=1 Tax=Pseudonocardia sp. WMMC193 TaxID=2911965 RepID=UPI001F237576|nr:hypothetical protein [Pseudonocardia sp. WMMC193]MCF7551004.1 hypothetical protein [Pseudonocardia sp. WMMC193]
MGCHLAPRIIGAPDTGGNCCEGAFDDGPEACTCWTPVYDLEQSPPDTRAAELLAAGIEPNTRPRMCEDCAYRPTSPERTGAEDVAGDAEFLERIARRGERFFCHQGIRRPVKLVHPSGAEIPGHTAAYDPPIAAGVPWRADGTPAELCAGWAARRRATLAAERTR